MHGGDSRMAGQRPTAGASRRISESRISSHFLNNCPRRSQALSFPAPTNLETRCDRLSTPSCPSCQDEHQFPQVGGGSLRLLAGDRCLPNPTSPDERQPPIHLLR